MALPAAYPEAELRPSRTDGLRSRALVRRLFLGGLALVHVASLVSFGHQLDGLVGSRGILPAAPLVARLEAVLGQDAYVRAPMLAYATGASDTAMHATVVLGLLFALLLLVDVLPFVATLGLYVVALSIHGVGQEFLSFQWDLLLIETTFLALALSPPSFVGTFGRDPEPSTFGVWTLRLLFVRFLFASGVVKLASGDATWHDLTALAHHYETTCLPTWTGWLAHKLPKGIQKASALAMFAIELVLPFFAFGPRWARRTAFVGSVALQLAIASTGNYGFFNFLTCVLSLVVLDDGDLPARVRTFFDRPRLPTPRSATYVAAPMLALYVVLAIAPTMWAFRSQPVLPAPLARLEEKTIPFRLANAYGLFAVMTTHRPEIVVEGSDDGRTWRAYEFRYKPGALDRRPAFVGLHMPRLDWQMWFSALGEASEGRFFGRFATTLLEASPPVLGLLAHDPFEGRPPRYLRAMRYEYRFTSWEEWRSTGAWWKREGGEVYLPAVEKVGGGLGYADLGP